MRKRRRNTGIHEIEILEDKVGQLKRTNKEMKRKIVTLQYQQDDQTNLMTNKLNFKGQCNQTSSSFSTVMKVRRQVAKWS